jgi:hypothetical protein
MRGGYWRIQLGRLRRKLIAGENTYIHRDGVFVIETLCAEEDSALDANELRLAADASGNWLALDPRTTLVTMADEAGDARSGWAVELAGLIDALQAARPFALELGPVVDGWDDVSDRHRSEYGETDGEGGSD